MILAVSTYSLSRWMRENNKTLEQTLDWMAQHDVKAAEFCGLDERAKDNPIARAQEVRAYVAKLGMEVAGYCVGGEFLCPPQTQKQEVARLKQDVDIAVALGAKTMRHDVTWGPTNGKNKPPVDAKTFPQVLKYMAPAIREVTEYAAGKGLKTSLENHGFYMQASERVEKLIQAVGHPNYGLTIDMGNFLCVNEEPVDAVKRLAKYAIMAHVKDFHVKPKKQMPPTGWFATPTAIALRGAIAGHGVIDIPAELKLLKKAGYDGYLSLEFEGMEEPGLAVDLGLKYLREQLKTLGVGN
ncbi:MAG: sugar phosphate isomerase/epimerase [Phycisphaeraceae bacterium]|nr:sugar phosphate isomerase/epimerase [Phycisphaeraceae bacterium]